MNSKSGRINLVLFLIFLPLFFWIHGHSLFSIPAINYDEVRAGNFAHQIVFESVWPVHGSNSYTIVFASYWAALFYKLLGAGLLPLRLSGIFAVLGGIIFFSAALYSDGKQNAARIFPFLVTCWPALFLNHRYGIEANTFQFFCLGFFLWGISKRKAWVIILATVLGVLSHPFFLAPVLATFLLFLFTSKERHPVSWLSILILFLLAYFFQILLFIPEKGKALALILLSFFSLGAVWQRQKLLSWFSSIKNSPIFRAGLKAGFGLLGVLGLISLGFVFTYTSSFWSLWVATGKIPWPFLNWIEVVFFGAVAVKVALLLKKGNPDKRLPLSYLWLFLLSSVFCALIMIQPSSRTFELSLILLGGLVATAVGTFSTRAQIIGVCLWTLLGLAQFHFNYLTPIHRLETETKTLRFLWVRGVTETYPSAQQVLEKLAQDQCQPERLPTRFRQNLDLWKDAIHFIQQSSTLEPPWNQCKL